jgi:hypothetical protein
LVIFGHTISTSRRDGAERDVRQVRRRKRVREVGDAIPVVLGIAGHAQPEEVLHLQRRDDDRDAAREPRRHRMRHELDQLAELRDSHDDQDHAGHRGREQQPGEAEFGRDRHEQRDERRGRPADVQP